MELTIIQKKIFEVRGHRVMLDRHLGELYDVPTKSINLAVKRNKNRFPSDFMFQLTKKEYDSLRFQFETLKRGTHSKFLPYVFTEHGVAMLSSVLRSKKAVEVNISIMRAFILLRQLAISHKELLRKIKELEKKYDKNFAEIYQALNLLLDPPHPKRKKVGYKHYDE
ncbi:MAG: ORF6N domain-containing protein [Bacteroidetes bacterium]|nr:ORF6N domain-containing protein [Bacteroidota bacterium]